MLYVLIFEDTDNGETYTSLWDDGDAALRQAVSEILADVNDSWDLDDSEVLALAKEMNDYAMNGDLPKVMELWNEDQNGRGGRYWSVQEKDICTAADASPIVFLSFTDEDEEDDEEVEEEEEGDSAPYLATTQGATCRGPCKNVSQDAYADRRDGTYCCWQCKLMGGCT